MTNATAKKTVEEIPVTTIVEEMRVTLNISIAEAETLKAILESIGGSTTYQDESTLVLSTVLLKQSTILTLQKLLMLWTLIITTLFISRMRKTSKCFLMPTMTLPFSVQNLICEVFPVMEKNLK